MKVKEFIDQLYNNLNLDAELDFLCIDYDKWFWLDVRAINMNADIDDPDNKNRGGITFTPRAIDS